MDHEIAFYRQLMHVEVQYNLIEMYISTIIHFVSEITVTKTHQYIACI